MQTQGVEYSINNEGAGSTRRCLFNALRRVFF